jgi:hypothetical protein
MLTLAAPYNLTPINYRCALVNLLVLLREALKKSFAEE